MKEYRFILLLCVFIFQVRISFSAKPDAKDLIASWETSQNNNPEVLEFKMLKVKKYQYESKEHVEGGKVNLIYHKTNKAYQFKSDKYPKGGVLKIRQVVLAQDPEREEDIYRGGWIYADLHISKDDMRPSGSDGKEKVSITFSLTFDKENNTWMSNRAWNELIFRKHFLESDRLSDIYHKCVGLDTTRSSGYTGIVNLEIVFENSKAIAVKTDLNSPDNSNLSSCIKDWVNKNMLIRGFNKMRIPVQLVFPNRLSSTYPAHLRFNKNSYLHNFELDTGVIFLGSKLSEKTLTFYQHPNDTEPWIFKLEKLKIVNPSGTILCSIDEPASSREGKSYCNGLIVRVPLLHDPESNQLRGKQWVREAINRCTWVLVNEDQYTGWVKIPWDKNDIDFQADSFPRTDGIPIKFHQSTPYYTSLETDISHSIYDKVYHEGKNPNGKFDAMIKSTNIYWRNGRPYIKVSLVEKYTCEEIQSKKEPKETLYVPIFNEDGVVNLAGYTTRCDEYLGD